jgi:hypothetical protein
MKNSAKPLSPETLTRSTTGRVVIAISLGLVLATAIAITIDVATPDPDMATLIARGHVGSVDAKVKPTHFTRRADF